ncbi:putative tetratricopeptide-like helical domain-containing protein [Medicago truncatula]|uniref:PPR containing plant-like protein n=1 Tax=Medicago truncatula TaxID=3880 RepID=Q1RSH5_MEDTR|nr:pentatricopeptide repeat-containing protein At3g23020 [Medicago truncatula]ABE86686.1 Tetratricopeptide-like helical [Medicago truncatula]AES61892.1 PPR containing plant-like protein [Medicago truncatula]RHN81225.1 putative tetratricopeptide-like helical domain-containing protein [Medicago truncatula]
MFVKVQLFYIHTSIFANANTNVDKTEKLSNNTPKKQKLPLKNGTNIVKRAQRTVFRRNQHTQLKKQCPEKNSGDGVVEKSKTGLHTKCSTKCVSYGGIIPSILKDLDTIQDVEEALRPWENKINNKERSIILKQQVKWDRALEIFNWFNDNKLELNVIHYNIMIRILGRAREWALLEGLWNQMNARGIVATNSTYGTLIDVYSKGGLREDALFWLETMLEHGIEPDEVTMVIVVQLYKKAGEFQKAEEFFRKWSLGEPLRPSNKHMMDAPESVERALFSNASFGSHTYNTLIDTYGKAGQHKEASETFAKMLKQGIPPTTVTFNTMIHICGNHGRLEEVSSLLRKMGELRCSPDTRTYNTLISLHTKHNDIDMATKYFKRMKESYLEPDPVSYRTLLYAYSIRKMVCEAEELITEMDEKGLEIDQFTQSALTRMYIEAGMPERSLLWFQRFHRAGNMTSECYAANIDAYGERGHISEAEKVFLWCQERKNLSAVEFNVMIKAYGVGKYYDKACQLFDSMDKHGVAADRCSYSSLIQVLASADQPHIAKPYLKRMQVAGLVTNCIPYCAVISCFVKLGQLEMAEGVYKEMIGHGVKPDIIVYGVLINALYGAGRVKEAISYANEIKRAGLPGNTVIYNSLIKLYTKVGNLREAQETYRLLQSSEEGPAVYSSNCMIGLYTKQSMVEQAKEIFETLKKNGTANEFSFAMMLCLYKNIERFDVAIQIANQMRKLELLTDSLSYNIVLDLYATAGRPKEAIEIFKDMVTASIQLDDCSLRSLRTLLLRYGASRQGVDNLQVMMKKDASHGLQAWMSALTSVLEIDDYDTDE